MNVVSVQSVSTLVADTSLNTRQRQQMFDPRVLPGQSALWVLKEEVAPLVQLEFAQANNKPQVSSPFLHPLFDIFRLHLGVVDVDVKSSERSARWGAYQPSRSLFLYKSKGETSILGKVKVPW